MIGGLEGQVHMMDVLRKPAHSKLDIKTQTKMKSFVYPP